MGRGDRRTKKGKISISSYGKTRPKAKITSPKKKAVTK
ncbi:MAG: 30S ribosomal protein THX [Saprospiraceae bacterium]|nr:30S ribosomal protein THX [Saprospiraceae bacterium]MBK8632497.1 30S ribosomal protein THX [Saprospiraceae bacterium]HMS70156.1 30S ribosomal protein THX [Saprospiraceae bacterium]HOY11537.1 30S ribosomal protein THX [Saprospiraceae bacterium]HPN68899.1 30S ribosomal protein THX [Saprospiraceae bacterium]